MAKDRLPYDSENLTPTEKACERMMKERKKNCCNCYKLTRLFGKPECTAGQNIQTIMKGLGECALFGWRKRETIKN